MITQVVRVLLGTAVSHLLASMSAREVAVIANIINSQYLLLEFFACKKTTHVLLRARFLATDFRMCRHKALLPSHIYTVKLTVSLATQNTTERLNICPM